MLTAIAGVWPLHVTAHSILEIAVGAAGHTVLSRDFGPPTRWSSLVKVQRIAIDLARVFSGSFLRFLKLFFENTIAIFH